MELLAKYKIFLIGAIMGALLFCVQIPLSGYSLGDAVARLATLIVFALGSSMLLKTLRIEHFIAVSIFGLVEGLRLTELTAFTNSLFFTGLLWVAVFGSAYSLADVIFNRLKLRFAEKIAAAVGIVILTALVVGLCAGSYTKLQDLRNMQH